MRPVHKNWAVRKPWEAAVPVGQANRRRASESLDDVPHRLPDLYGSLSTILGITFTAARLELIGGSP